MYNDRPSPCCQVRPKIISVFINKNPKCRISLTSVQQGPISFLRKAYQKIMSLQKFDWIHISQKKHVGILRWKKKATTKSNKLTLSVERIIAVLYPF